MVSGSRFADPGIVRVTVLNQFRRAIVPAHSRYSAGRRLYALPAEYREFLIYSLLQKEFADMAGCMYKIFGFPEKSEKKSIFVSNRSRGAFRAEIRPLLPDADNAAVGMISLFPLSYRTTLDHLYFA